ncbi:MAG: 1-deoxy-D-xylulose-5-phosphate reductoisomerase [Azospirillaceae bacterium]
MVMTAQSPRVEPATRRVTVLGATGSVGTSTLDLIARAPDRFAVEALTANRNAEALARQAKALGARYAAVADETAWPDLRDALAGTGIEAAAGEAAVVAAAERPADWVMASIVGSCGLPATLAAARRGAMVAFANKECLVSAGPLMMDVVRRSGATLLPVDSEHNAIFQVLGGGGDGSTPDGVERIVLTASGGPFRTADRETMAAATPDQAVAHPTWSMGAKISVDSATMMNKGLEVIEASYLFGLDESRVGVLVHPQSIVHGLVEWADGSVVAQLGTPDMRTPIAYALAWPERMATPARRLDLVSLSRLDFEDPSEDRFPALRIARDALRTGGSAPTILNAANETAVYAFLGRRIGFLDIERVVARTLDTIPAGPLDSLEAVTDIDERARRVARSLIAA